MHAKLYAAILLASGLCFAAPIASAEHYSRPIRDAGHPEYDSSREDCQTAQKTRTFIGAVTGGVAGGLLGDRIAARGVKEEGRILGAVVGAALGAEISRQQTECNSKHYRYTGKYSLTHDDSYSAHISSPHAGDYNRGDMYVERYTTKSGTELDIPLKYNQSGLYGGVSDSSFLSRDNDSTSRCQIVSKLTYLSDGREFYEPATLCRPERIGERTDN